VIIVDTGVPVAAVNRPLLRHHRAITLSTTIAQDLA
jgi:hypothetical protein